MAKGDLKEYRYISFDMVDRNGPAGVYLHCSVAWTVDGWTRVRAVNSYHHLMMMMIWCLMSLST